MSETTGTLLKKAREEKGISLGTVHEVTKIPLDVLRAIEEGYTLRTLSPFYYKGFIKIYAQYLNVEIKPLLDEQKKEELPQPVPLREEENIARWWEIVEDFVTPERMRLLAKVVIVTLAVFFAFKFVGFVVHKISSRPKRVSTPVKANQDQVWKKKEHEQNSGVKQESTAPLVAQQRKPEPVKEKKPPVEQKTTNTEVPSISSPGAAASAGVSIDKNVSLAVKAKKDSWLRVRVDEAVVFQGVLKKGIAETWIAQKEIELSGKNLNLLEFELNGKVIGTLGREDRGARKIIVTKNGLSVEK